MAILAQDANNRGLLGPAIIKPRWKIREKVNLNLQLFYWTNQTKIDFNGILTKESFEN
jgi:hypothetical protein